MRYNIFYILVLLFVFNVQSQTCDFNQSENFDGGSPYSWGNGIAGGPGGLTNANNSAPFGWLLETSNNQQISRLQTGAWDLTGYNKLTLSFDYYTECSGGRGCKWNNGSDEIIVKYSIDGTSLENSGWSTTTAQTSWGSSGTIEIIDNFTATTYVVIDLIAGNGDFAVVDNIVMQACYNEPTDPTNLTATNFTENSFDTSWDPSTDVEGAVTYNVYKDDLINPVASGVSSTSYSFTGLTSDTTYNIGVEAVDSDGHKSAQTTKSFTTNKAPSSIESNFNGGTLTVGAGTAFTTNNITVGGGNIVVNSNSTNSGMIVFNGTVTTNNTDKVTYKRYVPDNRTVGVTSPVKNSSTADFVQNNSLGMYGNSDALAVYRADASRNARFLMYNNPTFANDNSNFQVARAYATKRSGGDGTLSFEGDLHDIVSDSITITIPATVAVANTWRGIGNPWMSYLPGAGNMSNNFISQNMSLFESGFEALYVIDNGEWKIINNTTPVDYYIAPGQAFWIKLANNQATNISFPRSDQTIRKESETFYQRKRERSKISLFIEKETKIAKTDIFYYSFGSEGINPGYDGAAFQTKNFDIKTKLLAEDPRDLDFDIQVLSSLRYEEQTIPISVSSTEIQKVYFRIDHELIPDHLEIYLEDREDQRYYNLKNSRAYIKINKTENNKGRFYLHTKPAKFWEDDSEEDVNDIADAVGSKAFDFFNLKDNILHFEGVNSKEQVKVNLFNLNGYKVFDTIKDIDTSNNAIQLPYTLSEGIYIIELYRASGKKMTKKIIVR